MRIAIVNDMRMAVEVLRRVLNHSPGHQLAWVAHNGAEAVARCARDRPDLILMDLIMPEMDGIEATRRIMANTPCPIVVVTADVARHSSRVFEAMGAGALAAVDTPVLGGSGPGGSCHALLAKISTVAKLVSKHESGRPPDLTVLHPSATRENQLVAIGASAGGPAALAKILSSLPEDFPAALVIVQHVGAEFASDVASWLDQQTALRVRLAGEGDTPQAGTVLMAGREHHLVFAGSMRLRYTRNPSEVSYRPSIDVFFNSVRRHWQGGAVGVLLTGMGRDGAAGLKELRNNGCRTIAQDQATSAVYGMPKAAAELHAASEILPLNEIGPRLVSMLDKESCSRE
jgi:two-component system response regulator WspF